MGAALALSRTIGSQLVDIGRRDPRTLALAVVAVVLIALLAAWIPARQAATTNPMLALRQD